MDNDDNMKLNWLDDQFKVTKQIFVETIPHVTKAVLKCALGIVMIVTVTDMNTTIMSSRFQRHVYERQITAYTAIMNELVDTVDVLEADMNILTVDEKKKMIPVDGQFTSTLLFDNVGDVEVVVTSRGSFIQIMGDDSNWYVDVDAYRNVRLNRVDAIGERILSSTEDPDKCYVYRVGARRFTQLRKDLPTSNGKYEADSLIELPGQLLLVDNDTCLCLQDECILSYDIDSTSTVYTKQICSVFDKLKLLDKK
jgi:hypothetical protein